MTLHAYMRCVGPRCVLDRAVCSIVSYAASCCAFNTGVCFIVLCVSSSCVFHSVVCMCVCVFHRVGCFIMYNVVCCIVLCVSRWPCQSDRPHHIFICLFPTTLIVISLSQLVGNSARAMLGMSMPDAGSWHKQRPLLPCRSVGRVSKSKAVSKTPGQCPSKAHEHVYMSKYGSFLRN